MYLFNSAGHVQGGGGRPTPSDIASKTLRSLTASSLLLFVICLLSVPALAEEPPKKEALLAPNGPIKCKRTYLGSSPNTQDGTYLKFCSGGGPQCAVVEYPCDQGANIVNEYTGTQVFFEDLQTGNLTGYYTVTGTSSVDCSQAQDFDWQLQP